MTDSQPEDEIQILPDREDRRRNQSETAILTPSSRLRRALAQGAQGEGTSLGENQREIFLIIRGMVERLLVSENTPVVLGRADLAARFHPDVDMTPYGAEERGVSRAHARLHLSGRKLYVTDLASTNGTFLSGKRLSPNKPELLRKGDEILLGRLPVQVLF